MCIAAGVKYAFLPPYSPDLNPIEEAFANLKAWCQKHQHLAQGMEFERFLEYAMDNLKDRARGHFARSQVGVPIRGGSDEGYWDD